MDCRKRKHDLEEIIRKAEEGRELDHCEELYYLVHVFHMREEDAEDVLYQAKEDASGSSNGKRV